MADTTRIFKGLWSVASCEQSSIVGFKEPAKFKISCTFLNQDFFYRENHFFAIFSPLDNRVLSFFFRLFPIRGRHSAKVFSIRLGQLRLFFLLQPSPCLLSPNLSIFSLAFLSFFYQVLPSLSFFSQRNIFLPFSHVHTNVTLCPEVCLPALQFFSSLSRTALVLWRVLSGNTQCPSHHFNS